MSLIYKAQTDPKSEDLSESTNNDVSHPAEGRQASASQQQQTSPFPSSSSATQVDQQQSSEPLFQIKKWNLIAFWKWDADSDVCAICRANVMDACPTCQSENKATECIIVWGACKHSFHNCCVVKWVQRNNRCPLCQKPWKDCKKRQLN